MHSADPPQRSVPSAEVPRSIDRPYEGHRHGDVHARQDIGARARDHAIDEREHSNGQLPKHFVLLTIVTLGLYQVYWFYRNWRDLRDDAGKEVSPGWRTLGLMIPFVNFVMVYQQLSLIRDVAAETGEEEPYGPGLVTVVIVALTFIANLTMTWTISLLTVIPLIPVQMTLNRIWEHKQPGMPIRTEFDAQEVAILFVGAVLTTIALARTLGGA